VLASLSLFGRRQSRRKPDATTAHDDHSDDSHDDDDDDDDDVPRRMHSAGAASLMVGMRSAIVDFGSDDSCMSVFFLLLLFSLFDCVCH
jgi:hypothetical protein